MFSVLVWFIIVLARLCATTYWIEWVITPIWWSQSLGDTRQCLVNLVEPTTNSSFWYCDELSQSITSLTHSTWHTNLTLTNSIQIGKWRTRARLNTLDTPQSNKFVTPLLFIEACSCTQAESKRSFVRLMTWLALLNHPII